MILHRKQVEWLIQSSFTQIVYDNLNHTFVPCEAFLSSLLFSEHNPYRDEVSKNNFRYKKGAPSIIDDINLTEVLKDDSFFARKLSPKISQASLKKIESNIQFKTSVPLGVR